MRYLEKLDTQHLCRMRVEIARILIERAKQAGTLRERPEDGSNDCRISVPRVSKADA